MDCFKCKTPYNDSDRTPRLLIHCGHSICESCTVELYRDNFINCPECGFRNFSTSITSFPKNLALLHVKKGG